MKSRRCFLALILSPAARRVADLLLWTAATVLLLASVVRWLPVGCSVPDHLRIGLLWGALPLFLAAWLCGRRAVLLPVVAASLLNAAVVGTSFTSGPVPGPSRTAVALLHANVWALNPSMRHYMAMVREQRPDIAVTLERYHIQGYEWARDLADILPYRLDCGEADCGNNILSRWPLERLGEVAVPRFLEPGKPSFLAARVHRPEGAFTLVAVHMAQPFHQPVQDAQAAWLAERLRELPEPLVLSGDFNAAPWSPLMARIMADAGLSRLSVTGPTWPSPLLAVGIPIDHVLGSAGIGAVAASILNDVGSDHRPVLVRLTLPVVP